MNTSNYIRHGKDPSAVSIAGGAPGDYSGRQYKALAPKVWFFRKYKRDGDESFYVEHYREEVLSALDPEKVYKDLGTDSILLCWEPAGKFCHRRIVAEWLESTLGVKVPEIPECQVDIEEIRERFNFLRIMWENRGVLLDFGAYQEDKRIQVALGKIKVPDPGKGIGTKAMTDIINLADQVGADLYLVPTDSFGSDLNRLIAFYQRFKFKKLVGGMLRTYRG